MQVVWAIGRVGCNKDWRAKNIYSVHVCDSMYMYMHVHV